MNLADTNWTNELRSRFGDREVLCRDDCYRQYFEALGLPKDEIMECLNLIESEFEIPVGLLRPKDKLSLLFAPIQTKNPWKWLVYRTREEDSQSELNYRLSKKLRKHGTLGQWKMNKIESIEDLLRAWCGRTPIQAGGP